MSTKAEGEKHKLIQDKCQLILGNLLRDEDNKYCVDCDAKGPRWASWNLGIFLCIRCAGIHRNLGVHISKVKSVNLDSWTPEQVACLQQMGNSQARAVYEANLPENFRRPQTDSSLEAFIRGKYEQKKYIAKEWVPPPAPKPFNIEEEKRKEREKKKKGNKLSGIEMPNLSRNSAALPRPQYSGSVTPTLKVQPETKKPALPDTVDLLSLGDTSALGNDDIFDVFLSASVANVPEHSTSSIQGSVPESVSISNVSTDEADFFNQKSNAGMNQTNKMTKESILSLYKSNARQIPTSHHIAPVYGIPVGGLYSPQQCYTQVAMTGYQAAPNPSINVVSQQLTSLQLSGQAWNMSGNSTPVSHTGGLITAPGQSSAVWPIAPNNQSQNFSNNLWQ